MSDETSGGVTIGDVGGDIKGNVIAGGDVKDVTITLGGQPTPADKQPTVEEFRQLLAEIQTELAEVAAQQDALKEVSAAAPFTAQGAEQSVKAAAEKTTDAMEPEEAKSVQKSLGEATSLLGGILDGAKTVAEKATDVGRAVKPIAEKLEPLVEKLAVAALWASKLWLMG